MAGFGYSFMPGQNGDQAQQRPQAGGGPQSAIQMLSLRLPRVLGAQAMAPGALLNSQGGGGMPDPMLQAILRLAGMAGNRGTMAPQAGIGPEQMMPFQPPQQQAGFGDQSAPGPMTPRVIPGEEGQQTFQDQRVRLRPPSAPRRL